MESNGDGQSSSICNANTLPMESNGRNSLGMSMIALNQKMPSHVVFTHSSFCVWSNSSVGVPAKMPSGLSQCIDENRTYKSRSKPDSSRTRFTWNCSFKETAFQQWQCHRSTGDILQKPSTEVLEGMEFSLPLPWRLNDCINGNNTYKFQQMLWKTNCDVNNGIKLKSNRLVGRMSGVVYFAMPTCWPIED